MMWGTILGNLQFLKPQNRQKSGKYDEICMTCHWTDFWKHFSASFSASVWDMLYPKKNNRDDDDDDGGDDDDEK